MAVLDFSTGKPLAPSKGEPAPARAARRGNLSGKVHVAVAQLGMGDEAYRDLLDRLFGQRTSKGLSMRQLERLFRELEKLGWKPRRAAAPAGAKRTRAAPARLAASPLLRKIEALLAEKGRAEGKRVPWAYAEAILRRLYGPALALDSATDDQLSGVVAALVQDAKRKGRYVEEWGKEWDDETGESPDNARSRDGNSV